MPDQLVAGNKIVNGSTVERYRPEIPEIPLAIHAVTGSFENLKVTLQLPRGRFGGKEILSLVQCVYSNGGAGIAILIQKPNNPALEPEDWREPILSSDWKIVGGKLVDLKGCLKTNECGCLSSLLEKHFRDSGYDDLGWEKVMINGQTKGLRVFRSGNRR